MQVILRNFAAYDRLFWRMRGSEWLTTAMSKESNRNHALGSGQWLALVSIATTAIFVGASSIASAESPTRVLEQRVP